VFQDALKKRARHAEGSKPHLNRADLIKRTGAGRVEAREGQIR
jgi:hypothetical protein